ncbi:fasciclin domain-containing protein [Niabella ginsengisoli]|uniref:Fasciclin domain-containing protein n=2 Tax=Niabella ginsengisoli TaxID=522298 RepID=A0ABS9SN93_9BACT|nr:fasciclin domain-containing protein [Niabella ginsengisoli]
MFLNAGLSEGLYDGQYYQHSPKTVLIQSDDVWGFPLAEDLLDLDRQYRLQQCRAGIFNIDVRADNGFRKRFYPTNFGYILYDNGKFYDYTGNSINLISTVPEWEATNGAIYSVDGFLKPLDKLNDTLTVYNLIKKDPELSLYLSALDRSGIASQLQLTGFFTYSILAPQNAAITAAGISVATMDATQLRSFVQAYIIPNRYIFTDGDFNGQIANKNGERLSVGGQWESFTVTNSSGKTIQPVTANIQGSNGVIHKVNRVF